MIGTMDWMAFIIIILVMILVVEFIGYRIEKKDRRNEDKEKEE